MVLATCKYYIILKKCISYYLDKFKDSETGYCIVYILVYTTIWLNIRKANNLQQSTWIQSN